MQRVLSSPLPSHVRGYDRSDLDYNGDVDIADYFLIDRADAMQSGMLSTAPAAKSPALQPGLRRRLSSKPT